MSTKKQRLQKLSTRAGVLGALAIAALSGLAAPATALPTDPVVQFTPTLTRLPGPTCAAIINGETVPQPQSGVFGVRVTITQTGQNCGAYWVTVNFRNLDTGYTDGQSHLVDRNGVLTSTAPGNVIVGFGTAPRAGRIEATIVTAYEDHHPLEYLAGTATFTLG